MSPALVVPVGPILLELQLLSGLQQKEYGKAMARHSECASICCLPSEPSLYLLGWFYYCCCRRWESNPGLVHARQVFYH